MKNKGFTLSEILGLIVIIGLLVVIVGPTIVNKINKNKVKVSEVTETIIFSATEQHISENKNEYKNGENYCIKISDLINQNKLTTPLKDGATDKDLSTYSVMIKIKHNGTINYKLYEHHNDCEEDK